MEALGALRCESCLAEPGEVPTGLLVVIPSSLERPVTFMGPSPRRMRILSLSSLETSKRRSQSLSMSDTEYYNSIRA